tara:strand:+ start:414 stop:2018 length:1605 start_codon:yes stop_codon:yes gene_type:complete
MIKVPIFFQLNKLGIVGAQKELRKLTNQTKSFGLTSKLSIGAASVALTAYTKKALAAAIADEKAQKALTQTLKNLGLAYSTVSVTKYIDNLQRATGVSEDLLRPAFQRLVLVLGDVAKAQSALSLAMDVSAGTGKDLNAVSMALAKGYSGQTLALSRLGAGLSKTLLASGDMEAITLQLSKLFAGQALVAANTYAGQMAILGVAAQEASERIGIELINSLISLGGQDGAETLATQMERTATAVSEIIAGLTTVITTIKKIPVIGNIGGGTSIIGATIDAIRGLGRQTIAKRDAKTDNPFDRGLNNRALDLATKIVAKKKEAAKIDKASAATTKLQKMFDIDAIQIAAALKGNISELDRKNLLAMQALKTEDKNDDITALKEVEQAKINADAADRARKIKALQDTISFNKAALDDWQANFDKMNSNATKMLGLSAAAYSVGAPGSTQQTGLQQAQTDLFKGTLPDLSYLNFDLAALGAANAQMDAGIAAQQAANVTVNLQGGINIGSTLEFYQTVQAAVQEATRNGWSLAGTATG